MKNTLLLLLMVHFPADRCFCQNDSIPFRLELQLFEKESDPLSPLHFKAAVQNVSDSTYLTVPFWQSMAPTPTSARPLIKCRYFSEKEWQVMRHAIYEDISYSLSGSYTTNSSGSKVWSNEVEFVPVSYEYRSGSLQVHFDRPGKYFLKAFYAVVIVNESGDWEYVALESEEVPIIIKAYTGENAAAYSWLKTLKIPHFPFLGVFNFQSYFRAQCYVPQASGNFEMALDSAIHHDVRFLESYHPGSRFADWGKYLLSQYYLWVDPKRRNNSKKYQEKAVEMLFSIQQESTDVLLQEKITNLLTAIEKYSKD